MKCGIIKAISDGRLKDALRMLKQCYKTDATEAIHQYIATALIDGSGEVQYALALHARIKMQGVPDSEFRQQ